jgi:uncharacterized protein YecA (UPF0149 family)
MHEHIMIRKEEKAYNLINDLFDLSDSPDATASKNNANHLDKIGRNDLCPCGSGKKYKKCCGQ